MGDPGSSACIPDRVQTETTVQSPDGNHVFTVYQKQKAGNAARIYYRVSYKHKTVIEESELGVQVDNKLFEKAMGIPNDSCRSWCDDLELVATERGRVDETWKPLYGERSEYRDHYNELILKFRKGSDDGAGDGSHDKRRYYYMNLVIRAYNEGVAFRYAFPETSNGLFLHVAGEQTRFAFPAETLAYHEAWAQGPYALVKLENWKEESERPLTLKLANGLFVALSEAQLTDYARAKFALSDERNTLQVSLYGNVDVIAPYQTPWRVIMVAENAATLVENNYIILNLNDPCRIQDAGWIRPGKVIRVTRLNQADALKCVDFASARGLQYIHLDAGWYGKEFLVGSDATKVDSLKDLDIEALARYAATKNIGVFLYVNQRALERQLPAILPLYRKWGVKGIKFGFVQTGNQHWTTWLHDAVRACADHELMVDIHDEYRPTGFSRTYPNLLTQEGVRGNEEFPDATHDAILPFTRFLAGAADYTICYFDTRLKNTRAHQLALSVIYYSPLQFLYWYDTPDSYNGEPEVEFFDNVKSVWDDTRVLGGAIGEYIITARRSGDEWFIGAITNNDARAIAIPLHFLEENKRYTARIYADADAPGKEVAVYSADIVVPGDASPGETFTRESVMNFSLLSRGGVAIHVKAKQ
ncbi:MAG: glycoside hydrolase family 97 protein [Odoribacteraceae bacterium]|nr:glycoside hydrolase family 97 protein [Odoribacteraceae bacterium]